MEPVSRKAARSAWIKYGPGCELFSSKSGSTGALQCVALSCGTLLTARGGESPWADLFSLAWKEGRHQCSLQGARTPCCPTSQSGMEASLSRQADVRKKLIPLKYLMDQTTGCVSFTSFPLIKLRYNSHSVDFIYGQSCAIIATI